MADTRQNLTPEERAYQVCEQIYWDMCKRGLTTTCHYEAGVPLIAKAIREAVAEAVAEALAAG